jgi:hypothetical protein
MRMPMCGWNNAAEYSVGTFRGNLPQATKSILNIYFEYVVSSFSQEAGKTGSLSVPLKAEALILPK